MTVIPEVVIHRPVNEERRDFFKCEFWVTFKSKETQYFLVKVESVRTRDPFYQTMNKFELNWNSQEVDMSRTYARKMWKNLILNGFNRHRR